MESNNDLRAVIELSKYRWAMHVLIYLNVHDGARFVELRNRLGISRESLRRTLQAGIDAGWIKRNEGHGHPLRPEYLLNQAGRKIALRAGDIVKAQNEIGLDQDHMKRWELPILYSISLGQRRFNEIERTIKIASPGALSHSLKALTQDALVIRDLIDGYPPMTQYGLSPTGQFLAAAI